MGQKKKKKFMHSIAGLVKYFKMIILIILGKIENLLLL